MKRPRASCCCFSGKTPGIAAEAATDSAVGGKASAGSKAEDDTGEDTPVDPDKSSRFMLDEDGFMVDEEGRLLLEILGGLNPGTAADGFWGWLTDF